MKRLSIKLRITLWFTAFIVVLTAAMLVWLFALGERTAQQALRTELVDAAEDSFRDLNVLDGTLEIDDDLHYFHDGVYLLLFDEAGHPLFGRLPRGLSASLPFEDGGFQTYQAETVKWYVYDTLYRLEGYGGVWVRSVTSATDTENAFDSLNRLAIIILPLLALIAAVGGYLLINRGFRPVRRITQTAELIGDGSDLTRRIGLPEGKDEIHTLAAAFDRMFDRLESSFEREKRFTSDASHELRTPVAVILTQCEAALESAGLSSQTREALESIQRQGKHMSALISQLLTLARADKGHQRLKDEPVDMSMLAELVAEELSEAAQAKVMKLHLDIQPDISVLGDQTMLMRLWLNLIENAIKYGRENGNIWVRLSAQAGRVMGEVEDDGVGLSPDELPKIWERFYRAGSEKRDGSGLGLPMVRFIVQAHGGEATARSTQGEGSVFSFWIPEKKQMMLQGHGKL